jgi:chromosome segregation ATPase
MIDDTSLLTMLSRREHAPAQRNNAPSESVSSEGFWMRQVAELQRDAQMHASATKAAVDAYQKACDQHEKEMSAMRDRHQELQREAAEAKAKLQILESRPPEVRVERAPADEAISSKNTELEVKCARLEGMYDESARTISILREQVARLEAAAESMIQYEERPQEQSAAALNGYDIDVMRGGDDRIRSLRVRLSS